jgi:hypothetical protein
VEDQDTMNELTKLGCNIAPWLSERGQQAAAPARRNVA